MYRFSLPFLLSLLIFTGCSINQKEQLKSSIIIPKKYTQPQLYVNNKWWEQLNDAQLNALIETALQHNRDLKVAIENIKAASALLKQSSVAQTINVDVTASASHSLYNSVDDTDLFSLGLGASYELDVWGRLDSLENASRYDFNVSSQDLQSVAITVSAEVALAWYRLLEQQRQLQLLEKQIVINEQYLQLLISRFNISNIQASDIIQQRQSLVALSGEKELTLSQLKQYKSLLALLLGTDVTNLYPKGTSSFLTAHKNLNQAFNEIPPLYTIGTVNLLERPDIQAAYFRVQANSERVAASISNSYPRISLSASAGTSSTTARDIFKDWFATLAANLTAPLFDGGRREAEVRHQEAKSRAALYTYEQTLLKALKEVEDTQNSLSHQHRYLNTLKEQLTLSLASMQRIRQQYIHANSDFLRLLSAQLNYEQLQRNYLKAERELIEKNIALHRAVASKIIPLPNSGETK